MRWVQWAAGLGLTGLLLGCSAAGPVVETPPPLPTHFRPGPPLGAPDPIEADAPGRDYLLAMSSVLQPRWASFLEDLRLRLPPEHPLNRKDLVVELEIRLNSDGVLEAVNVAASSGAEDFDRAAVEVVSDAQPFARPPEPLASDDETFRFRWRFARDRRQAGPATARVEMMRWPLSKAVPELLAADRIGEALRRVAAAGDSAGPHLRTIATAVVRRGLEARKLEAVSLVDDPQFADQIARIVDSARSVQLRQAAIEALGRVAAGPEARLSRLVQAREPEIARAAAAALVARGQGDVARTKIVARLGDPSSRRGALAVLAEVSAPAAADQLIGLARNSSGDVRLEAIRALGVTAGSASAAARARLTLGKLLKTRDRALRAAACTALASSAEASAARRRSAYWAAVELLRSRDQVVRGACAMAAARLSPRLFARELYRVRRDRSRPVRLGLARGLRAVPGKDALGLLVSLSRSKDAEIRARAARSLAARSEPEAAEAHRRLLADAEASVRRAALEGVPASEIPRAALDDPSSDVRVLAVRKLVAAGRAEGLAVVLARRMDAADEAERLRLACAWLSVRQAQGRR